MLSKTQKIQNFQQLISATDLRIQSTVLRGIPVWDGFEVWRTACSNAIEIIFGAQHRSFIEFQNIRFSANPGSSLDQQFISHIIGLQIAKEKLQGILYTITVWVEDEVINPIQPIAFISHDSRTGRLQKLRDFLVALGVKPIIIEELPDIGMSINQKVQNYMNMCNVGLALITKADRLEGSDEIRGRPNVDHEIGMMMSTPSIGPRLILLKEKGVSLPTNYSERVYSEFSRLSMDDAFTKIVKNLKAFGFLS